jgi:hypothetical protein
MQLQKSVKKPIEKQLRPSDSVVVSTIGERGKKIAGKGKTIAANIN